MHVTSLINVRHKGEIKNDYHGTKKIKKKS